MGSKISMVWIPREAARVMPKSVVLVGLVDGVEEQKEIEAYTKPRLIRLQMQILVGSGIITLQALNRETGERTCRCIIRFRKEFE